MKCQTSHAVILLGIAITNIGGCSHSPPNDHSHQGKWYVNVLESPIMLGPSASAKTTGAGYRQDTLEVYEVKDGWGRISKYYDARIEELSSGKVARWIAMADLSRVRPADMNQPGIKPDTRIEGIPSVGKNGLVERDILVLHAAARYYLETGQATHIEWGDKSLHRPGYYYFNFGGNSNFFFRPEDIPNLERRIKTMSE